MLVTHFRTNILPTLSVTNIDVGENSHKTIIVSHWFHKNKFFLTRSRYAGIIYTMIQVYIGP